MTDNTNENLVQQQLPEPSAALKALDKLVGTWNVSGGVQGTTIYAWMDGGFFLMQHIDFVNDGGDPIKGMEIIGQERVFGATEPSQNIKSRYYGSEGSTFDYVYELEGDTIIIWGGEKGSPAYYKGTLSEDGNSLSGEWVYPGGGGYESSMTRVQ